VSALLIYKNQYLYKKLLKNGFRLNHLKSQIKYWQK